MVGVAPDWPGAPGGDRRGGGGGGVAGGLRVPVFLVCVVSAGCGVWVRVQGAAAEAGGVGFCGGADELVEGGEASGEGAGGVAEGGGDPVVGGAVGDEAP